MWTDGQSERETEGETREERNIIRNKTKGACRRGPHSRDEETGNFAEKKQKERNFYEVADKSSHPLCPYTGAPGHHQCLSLKSQSSTTRDRNGRKSDKRGTRANGRRGGQSASCISPSNRPPYTVDVIDCILVKSRTMRFEVCRQKQTSLFSWWLPREGYWARCVAGKEPHETMRVTKSRAVLFQVE